MSTSFSLHPVVRRSLTWAVFAGAGLAVAGAQTVVETATAPAHTVIGAQPLTVQTAPFPGFAVSAQPLFSDSSSSSDGYNPEQSAQTQLASLEKSFGLPDANAMQYGQRRRYGAPRYRGGNTNADGSEKYTGYAGVGLTVPVSGTSDYLATSYGIQAGAGRNFNKHLGVNVEFDYDRFGLTASAINNFLYLNTGSTDNSTYGLDGNNHIWSFSVQPVVQIYSGQGLGAYITGGVGFYHKVTNFTLPQTVSGCGIYGCGYFTQNVVVDHYTSNAPGYDGGLGLTYKFSRFSNERLYAEVRYVYIDNQFKPGATNASVGTYVGYNYFPANSLTTSYIPVKVGVRF